MPCCPFFSSRHHQPIFLHCRPNTLAAVFASFVAAAAAAADTAPIDASDFECSAYGCGCGWGLGTEELVSVITGDGRQILVRDEIIHTASIKSYHIHRCTLYSPGGVLLCACWWCNSGAARNVSLEKSLRFVARNFELSDHTHRNT